MVAFIGDSFENASIEFIRLSSGKGPRKDLSAFRFEGDILVAFIGDSLGKGPRKDLSKYILVLLSVLKDPLIAILEFIKLIFIS
ncbi:hypothetical protein RHOW815_000270 [Candidatus Rhabdochlamydia sp. W815]|nr:hypothetical protein RHOW815_000270 [Candidatus Rhabdochlamydia sp. W815]